MIRKLSLFVLLACIAASAAQPRTMRLDYFHTGNDHQEIFSFDQLVLEPLAWPGNMNKTIDDSNLGKYQFEVRDRATNKLLYSRGFASIFGEWETTDEAKSVNRTFSESLRFPAPEKPVQVILKKRDEQMAFHEVWSMIVDPKDKFIDRSTMQPPAKLIELQKSGDPATKVDFLILGDGYTAAEAAKFEKDARRLMALLFATSPYKEHQSDFNVWGLCPAAEQSGISRPSTGIYRHSPVGATYDAFDSERYVLTFDNKSFRTIAQFAPYEFVEILTNSNTYGGGGIHNLYSTVAADSEWSPYVFVHEFGHHFAGLGDEYYTSDVSYGAATKKVEPWDPNITALLDKKDFKWADMVTAGTPLPTPWKKAEFEEASHAIQARRRQIRAENKPEAVMDALFREEKQHEDQLLDHDQYSGKVGAFEGALYEAKGYYRPEENCIMFTRYDKFCAVCRRAIERVIAMYAGQ